MYTVPSMANLTVLFFLGFSSAFSPSAPRSATRYAGRLAIFKRASMTVLAASRQLYPKTVHPAGQGAGVDPQGLRQLSSTPLQIAVLRRIVFQHQPAILGFQAFHAVQ